MAISNKVIESEESLARNVDDAILYLSCSDAPKRITQIPAVIMDGESLERFKKHRIESGLPYAVQLSEMPSSWESSVLLAGSRHLNKEARYEIGVSKKLGYMDKAKLKQIGMIRSALAPLVKSSKFTLLDDGKYKESDGYYLEDYRDPGNPYTPITGAIQSGKKLHRITSGGNWRTGEEMISGESSMIPAFCQSITWICQHVWQVVLSQGKESAKVSFITDATGVKGFFQLRDVPEGATRRLALIHWVREHWRKNRNDKEDEIKVKEHLRGNDSFSWMGFTGSVVVPPITSKSTLEKRS